MNVYNEILNLFKSTDELRPWMNEPFTNNNGKVFSTDGVFLCIINQDKIDWSFDVPKK